MGLFGLKFRKFTRNNITKTDNAIANKINQVLLGLGLKYIAYDKNNGTYLEKGYNSNGDVYSVVNQKSTEVTRIPYFIKSVKDELSKNRYQQFNITNKGIVTPSNIIKRIKHEVKAFEEKEKPMPLECPNRTQTWRDFFALYQTFMDITGNFFMYLRMPEEGINAGVPIEVYVLPAHLIEIVLKDNADLLSDEDPISHYILTESSSYIKFEANEVIHIKKPNPNFNLQGSHLYGQSPLRAVLDSIQSSNSARRLNAKTLANGGSFGFISGKEPLREEQAKAIKDRLIEMDNSPQRLSNLAGASSEVVFTRISLTTDELKPFEYLEYDQKQICNALNWDDKLLNSDDGAKYDNYKTALRRSISSGVSPNLRILEETLNNKFLPLFKDYRNTVILFDESQLPEMQEDMEKLTKWLNETLDRGVISRDEYRLAINYTELGTPEMTTHTVSTNIVSLTDALITDNLNLE